MNESEGSNDDKTVEKAISVTKWCWDNSFGSGREEANDSLSSSLLSPTKVKFPELKLMGGRLQKLGECSSKGQKERKGAGRGDNEEQFRMAKRQIFRIKGSDGRFSDGVAFLSMRN